ncbi:MAG: hypothetical protein IT458_03285 [Planctomycetes bacterium]|nr:hypothetical protein [Planctomycetota bacterium]
MAQVNPRRPPTLLGSALLGVLSGCATESVGSEPVPAPRQRPQVSIQTYDELGRPTDGKALGAKIWGLGEGGFERAGAVTPQDPATQGSTTRPVTIATQPLDPASQTRPLPEPEARGAEGAGTGALPEAAQPQQEVPAAQDPELQRQEEALLRTRFGPNVLIHGDGRVTKQYFLSGESGQVFLSLISEPVTTPPPAGQPAPAPIVPPPGSKLGGSSRSVLGRMLAEHEVELMLLPNFEPVETTDITAKVSGITPPPASKVANSLLLVTAQPTALAAFENALNLFFGQIPQVEIEVKVVEFQASDALTFGVSQVGTTPLIQNTSSGQFIKSLAGSFPLNPPFFGGGSITDRGILTIGGIHDGIELNAQIQALELQSKADVLTHPRLVVRNGGIASITTTTDFPFPKAKIVSQGVNVATDIEFKPVGVTLNIRPVIAGTEMVILQIFADVSAVTGFAPTDPVKTPIVSKRQAVTSVHVPNGKTTIIGGLISKSTLDVESKIPLLGDIPLLGILFRSTSTNTSSTDLRFFITPRIIQGARGFRADAVAPVGG